MKKIILFSVMMIAVILLRATSSTVWSGAFDSGSWSNTLSVEAQKFADIEVGDAVQFVGTANGGAQIQINDGNWNKLVDYDDFNGDYRINVTSDNINNIKSGLNIKGQNMKITKINIISVSSSKEPVVPEADGTVWSGSFSSGGWNNQLDINGNVFAAVEVGDKVSFIGSAQGGAQIQISDNDWNKFFEYKDFSGTYTMDVTADNIAAFKAGLHIKGNNMTITTIKINASQGSSDEEEIVTPTEIPAGNDVWTGSFNSGSWGSQLDLDASIFSSLKAGDKVAFIGTAQIGSEIQINDANWNKYVDYDTFDGCYIVEITASNLSIFKNGLHIKGNNMNISAVRIASSGNGGNTDTDTEGDNDDNGDNNGGNTGSFGTGDNVWEGTHPLSTWNSDALSIDASYLVGLNAGDYVVIKGTASSSTAEIQISYGEDWDYIVEYDEFTGEYKLLVTNITLPYFMEGIHIKGHDMTIKSVQIAAGSTPLPPVEVPTGCFHADGTKIIDANGNEFLMRGVNYSYCWQSSHLGTVIPAAKRQGFNCVRIQLSDGGNGTWTTCNATQLENIIKLCEQNQLIVVLNTHDETGNNDVNKLKQAANYWVKMKDVLNRHLATVIVNVSNEWYGSWSSQGWADGYKTVIPIIRDGGVKNMLMVDCAGYGQYPKSIFDKGAEVLAADAEQNMCFSIHMYEYAGADAETVKSNIDKSLALGCPLVIGEFGYSRESKPIAYQTILDYGQQKHVGWIGWSWTGNSGSDAVLDMFSGYDDSNMLTNGDKIINSKNGVKETSVICSVYTGEAPITGDEEGGNTDGDEEDDNQPTGPQTGSTDNVDGMTSIVVWSGKQTFDASWDSELKITADKYNGISTDCYLRFKGTAGSEPQIQLNYNNKFVYDVAADGSLLLKVSQDVLDILGSKMIIKGKNFNMTEIDLIVPKGSVVNESDMYATQLYAGPSVSSTGWCDDSKMVTVANGKFIDAKVGDRIRVNFSNLGENPQVTLAYKANDATWTWQELATAVDVSGTSYSYIIPDAETLTALKEGHGLNIKYTNLTVNTVDLLSASKPTQYASTVVWEGNVTAGANWTSNDASIIKINPEKFANLAAGDRIRITFSAASASQDYCQYQIVGWYPSIWHEFEKNLTVVPDQQNWIPTAEQIAAIKTEGLALKGNNTITTKVEILSPSDDDNIIAPAPETPATLKGDINGDGKLSAADVNALTALVRKGKADISYDINGDGKISAADINALMSIIRK